MAQAAALSLGKQLLPILKPYALKGIQNVLGPEGQARRAKRRARRRNRRNGNVGRVSTIVPRNAPMNMAKRSTVATASIQIISLI